MLVNNFVIFFLQMLLNTDSIISLHWTPRDNKINDMGGVYRRPLQGQIDLAFLEKKTVQYFDGGLDIL